MQIKMCKTLVCCIALAICINELFASAPEDAKVSNEYVKILDPFNTQYGKFLSAKVWFVAATIKKGVVDLNGKAFINDVRLFEIDSIGDTLPTTIVEET